MTDFDYIIYTDGSANSSDRGASACIVQDIRTKQEYYIVGSYGNSTNNQSELFATFLGYALVTCLKPGYKLNVKLCSDSTYVLNSSCQHIHSWLKTGKINMSDALKNAHFWRVFVEMSRNINITPEHTPGHTGIPENERCDFAAKWTRKNLTIEPDKPLHLELKKTSRTRVIYQDNWFIVNFDELFHNSILELKTPQAIASEITAKIGEYLTLDLPTVSLVDITLQEMKRRVEEVIDLPKRYGVTDSRLLEILEKFKEIEKEIGDIR